MNANLAPKPKFTIPRQPHMPSAAVARLRTLMGSARCYIEFGSGGSTVMAGETGVGLTISVESDADWADTLREETRSLAGERVILHADIGPTGEWGRPVSDAHWKKWSQYPLAGWGEAKSRGLAPDLVLIDGRFRKACFYAALLFAKPGGAILFDDYVDRPAYHQVEALQRPLCFHDRMAEFVAPSDLDRDRVWGALVAACTDPS